MSLPTSTPAWKVTSQNRDSFDGLELIKDTPLPELGEHDVLVQIDAVSLNFRDLAITRGLYPLPVTLPVVAGSDASGSVLAVGSGVSEFKVGAKICTLFNVDHQTDPITLHAMLTNLGGTTDGTLRKYAVFPERALVAAPTTLDPVEASTLSCAPVTAWNALYGLRPVKRGDWVLSLGTGGVSLFGIQLAAQAGATVVVTTSKDERIEELKKLGASHVINYKKDPEWGQTAKNLTPDGVGFDHILENSGNATIVEALKAVKPEGIITMIGILSEVKHEEQPPMIEALFKHCVIRGVFVGSKAQFREMNAVIDKAGLHPVVDQKVFAFEDAKAAYEYQWTQKNFGKVVIKMT